MADREGGNGLAWISAPDARTPVFRVPATNKGFDNATPQYDQYRYIDEKASVTVATGAEARLINAEAALQRGTSADSAAFLAFLNGLRAAPPLYFLIGDPTLNTQTIPPLAPLAAPASAAAAISMLFNERARWLWLTSHRLNDLRRLVRPQGTRGGYGLAVNSVFPTGPYFKNGLTYGNDVNLPVPVTEQNNPNFTQCLDVYRSWKEMRREGQVDRVAVGPPVAQWPSRRPRFVVITITPLLRPKVLRDVPASRVRQWTP